MIRIAQGKSRGITHVDARYDSHFDNLSPEDREAHIFDSEVPDVVVDETVLIPHPAFALLLIDPKTAFNVATCVRSASAFQCARVWKTGKRVDLEAKGRRLPREERMKGYKQVELAQQPDNILDRLPQGVVPVAVEVRDCAVPLPYYIHPAQALYVFGPEDGSIPGSVLAKCHEHVVIPARHCFNLGVAASIVLYDRMMKALRGELREAL